MTFHAERKPPPRASLLKILANPWLYWRFKRRWWQKNFQWVRFCFLPVPKDVGNIVDAAAQVEEVVLTWREREAYEKFEKVMQERYMAVRHRLRYERGSHTMAVLTVLSKFRQV